MAEIAALGLRVDGVEGVDKAATSLNRLKDSSRDAGASSAKLGVESKISSKSINELANQSNKASSSVSALAGAAKAAGGVLIAAFSVAKLAGYADAWSDLQSRVGAATGSMEGAAGQMDRLLKIANASYSPLAQTAEIYSRNVSTFKDLGRSASEAADFTESLNHMLVLTATRGQHAESVQNALSKAMAVGKLQADGLETVLANGGEVAQALARELGTTVSGLREMASQGKITGDVIATSIVKSLEDVRKRADEMPATIGDAFARVGNNLTAFVGTMDQATGASGAVAAAIIELSDTALEFGTSEEFITGLLEWQGTLTALAEDFGRLGQIISDFAGDAGEDARSIGFSFGEIPANIRAAIQIATTEIAHVIHSTINGVKLLANAVLALKDGPGAVAAVFNKAKQEQIALNQARLDSITGILEERQAILDGAAASAKAFKERTSRALDYTATAVKATNTITKEQERAAKAAAQAAERHAKNISDEITALERAAIVWGMAADEVKLYDLRVMGATDTQLAYAKSLLDTVEGFEQQKEKQDNYLRLVQDLRTDEERLTDQLRERLAVLDAINGASQQDYSRAAAAAMQEAPRYGGLAPEVGGPLGELNKIDEAQEKLQEWYSTQLSMLEQFRAERSDLSAQWDEQELALKQEHEDQLAHIEQARQQARMAAGEEFFGNLSGLTKAFFGENSKLYKAAFLVEKAYAINKALINAPKSYSDAYAATVGIPVVGPALAPAAGAVAAAAQVAQASAIGSINMPSFDGGGYTGDGARAGGLDGKGGFLAMMHPRETVTDHTKGQSVGGNVVVNINEDASRAGQVNESQQDDQRVIDIFVSNIMGDGQAASVIQNKFGLTAQGR